MVGSQQSGASQAEESQPWESLLACFKTAMLISGIEAPLICSHARKVAKELQRITTTEVSLGTLKPPTVLPIDNA